MTFLMTMYEMVQYAARVTGVPEHVIYSSSRTKRASYIRFAIWYVRRQLGFTVTELAEPFKRDHTAVIYGLLKAKDLLLTDVWFQQLVKTLQSSF